jgi:predicted DNA-binding antitoxin AbrB/MazE fold protein
MGMRQRIDAIYENGLLRPLEPLTLTEQQRVSVTIEADNGDAWLDHDALVCAAQEGDGTISLDDVRGRLAKLTGTLSELVISERGEY